MSPFSMNYRSVLAARGRLLIPHGLTRVPGGLWVGSACTTRGLVGDWLLGRTTQLAPRAFARSAGPHPVPDLDWQGWRESVIPESAGPERWAIGLPRDRRRQRFQLFIPGVDGRLLAFAKFSRNPHSELMLLARHRLRTVAPATFTTPRPIAEGSIDGWWYSVDLALPPGLHRPAALSAPERRSIVQEIQDLLGDLVGSPSRVTHGDFGPWNVRRGRQPQVIVLDWEDVTSGPDAADELWHSINEALIRRACPPAVVPAVRKSLLHHDEGAIAAAASFWLQRLDRPEAPEVDVSIAMGIADKHFVTKQRHALEQLSRGSLGR